MWARAWGGSNCCMGQTDVKTPSMQALRFHDNYSMLVNISNVNYNQSKQTIVSHPGR